MTNHDNPLPDGQKPLNEAQPWTATINHQITNNSDIYKYLMSPTITTLNESISAWMRQATCIDVVIPKIVVDMSSITTQAQMVADIIKPDYTNMVAGLAEISKVSLATQAQAIANTIKPDYTNIFANLSEFSTVSMATQAKMIADIIKPNVNAMFASLAKISMPTMVNTIKFDFNNKAQTPFAYVPNHHQKPEHVAAIWSTAYDSDTLHRREKVVAILKESGIHYETPLFGAYDTYMRKHIDYKRHVFSSLRTVLHDLVYLCVKGIDTDDICEFLEKKEVQKKHYTNKDGCIIRSHAAVLYLSIVRPIPAEKKNRLIRLSIRLNDLHTANIQRSDLKVYQMILEMEVMICEVFPDWLNLGPITPSC